MEAEHFVVFEDVLDAFEDFVGSADFLRDVEEESEFDEFVVFTVFGFGDSCDVLIFFEVAFEVVDVGCDFVVFEGVDGGELGVVVFFDEDEDVVGEAVLGFDGSKVFAVVAFSTYEG